MKAALALGLALLAGAHAAPRSLLQAPTEPVQTRQPMQPGAPAPEITPEMFTMVQPATVGAPIATQSLELRMPAVDDPQVMQWMERLRTALADPANFDSTIKELLVQDRGLSILAAAMSSAMTAAPQAVTEILDAIVRAYPTVINAPGPFEPGSPEYLRDAFILAAFDQMKGNAPVAGEAFWWAMSGGAGAGLARKAFVRILFLEARTGCGPPLTDMLAAATQAAQRQAQAAPPTATASPPGGAQDVTQGASAQSFARWMEQSRQTTACLLAASPEGQMLLQQQGYAGAPAAEPTPTLMPGQTQPAPTETPPPTQP